MNRLLRWGLEVQVPIKCCCIAQYTHNETRSWISGVALTPGCLKTLEIVIAPLQAASYSV